MTSVFISYRRSDAAAEARSVAERLRLHASRPQVFHDNSEILPGDLWRKRIDDALASCDVMLVVIGPDWLAVEPGAAQPRLFDPDDIVAYEIGAGLRRGVRIVPLQVTGARLPARQQLPEALAGLLASNAIEIRDAAFDRDMRALEAGILPPAPRSKAPWIAAAALGVLAVAGGGWALRPHPEPPGPLVSNGPVMPAQPAPTGVDLDVDLAFVPHKAMELLGLPASSMELVPEKPKKRGPLKLERQASAADAPLRFLHQGFQLPAPGETFVGTLARNLDGAVQVTAGNVEAILTGVCFDVTRAAPPADGKLHLSCREGQRCVPDGGSGGIVVACGATRPVAAWHWDELLPSAMAQPAPVSTDARPAPGDWLVPRLRSLRERRGTPRAVAFSDVTLTLALPPELPAADEASYEITVNGHRLWVNGLPAWTHARPFKVGAPLELAFGLENLDATGKYNGKERVELRALLLRDKQTVFEDRVNLDFFALRNLAEQGATSAAGQPVRWSASYFPAPADRYQIFAYGGAQADTLAAGEKLLAAGIASSAQAGALPLVGVVRPPNKTNPAWGVAVGAVQPSGQVRFSFRSEDAKALCAWMAEDAQARRLKGKGFAAPSAFRVREIAFEVNDATQPKPALECSVFGKA